MANYRGHIAGGTLFGVGLIAVLGALPLHVFSGAADILNNTQQMAGIVIVSILFGLFPDIDTNSKAQNLFFGLAFVVNILLIYAGLFQASAYLGLLCMTPIVGKHRGWTHSKWAMLLVPLPIIILPYLYNEIIPETNIIIYLAAVSGYFSHLLFDGLIWRRFKIKN